MLVIFQKGSKEEVTNSKLTSVPSFFNKCFANAMHERLNNYIANSNILFPSHAAWVPIWALKL